MAHFIVHLLSVLFLLQVVIDDLVDIVFPLFDVLSVLLVHHWLWSIVSLLKKLYVLFIVNVGFTFHIFLTLRIEVLGFFNFFIFFIFLVLNLALLHIDEILVLFEIFFFFLDFLGKLLLLSISLLIQSLFDFFESSQIIFFLFH